MEILQPLPRRIRWREQRAVGGAVPHVGKRSVQLLNAVGLQFGALHTGLGWAICVERALGHDEQHLRRLRAQMHAGDAAEWEPGGEGRLRPPALDQRRRHHQRLPGGWWVYVN